MKFLCGIILWVMMASNAFASADFDHQHELWNQQVARYVHWLPSGHDSLVDYTGWGNDRKELSRYLQQLSSVTRETYEHWSKAEKLAFLINAYNAFTVELVLNSYPNIDSIKQIGGWFRSPWRLTFFHLLGQPTSLNDIEHVYLRQQGVFDDPRIHFAIVCASLSCPPLSDQAYQPQVIDAQLEVATQRFLSDRQRNRFDVDQQALLVSSIFKWFGEDFIGYRGSQSLADFFRPFAGVLTDHGQDEITLGEGQVTVQFLDYDWELNDYHR